MDREIASPFPVQQVIDDGDMVLYRALPAAHRVSVGPFVFLDHYRHHSRRGIGDKPHPHAGIEVSEMEGEALHAFQIIWSNPAAQRTSGACDDMDKLSSGWTYCLT